MQIPTGGEPHFGPPDPSEYLMNPALMRPADMEPPEYEFGQVAAILTLDARQAYQILESCKDADEHFEEVGMKDSLDAKANRDIIRRLVEAGAVDPDE